MSYLSDVAQSIPSATAIDYFVSIGEDKGMENLREFFRNRRNLISAAVLIFIAISLPLGIYLLQQQQTYKSSAAGELIQLIDGPCIQTVNGKKSAICSNISLKLFNPFATTSASVAPSPTATSTASANPSPTSQNASPSPSPSPSAVASCGSPRTIRATTFAQMKQALSDLQCSGGAVYIPAGNYSLTENLSVPSNVTLFGDGDSTVLTMAAHETGISNKAVRGGDTNVVIRDLKVVGDGGDLSGGCCYGIRLRSISNSYVINVTAEAFSGDGIALTYKHEDGVPKGVKNTRITGCKLSRNDRQQIGVIQAEGVVIDNCSIDADGWGNGIDLEPDAGGDTSANSNKILNNNVFGPSAGITLLGAGGESGDPNVVKDNAVCNNNVTVSGIKYANGGINNIFVGNQGGNIDVISGGNTLTGPASACDIPAALATLPARPAAPAAMRTDLDQKNFTSLLLDQILSIRFIKKVEALGLATSLANSPFKEKLVSYWKFDETSGNFVADTNFQSANGTGTATGTTIVDGKFGKARSIPAGAGISIPNIPEFGDNVMSISGWIKPTTTPAGASIWNQPEGTSLEYSPAGDGTIRCVIRPIRENVESTFSVSSALPAKVNLNAWNHVACTFDMQTLNLYINGVLVASGAKVGWLNQPRVAQAASIGKNIATGTGINGAVDDMAYWNRALTQAEVASIYNGGQGQAIDLSAASGVQASSSPQVSPPPAGTSYRLAETQAQLVQKPWISYTTSPIITNFTVSSTPGAKQIWVEFRSNSGQTITDHIGSFDLLSPAPVVTGVNCSLDLTNKNLKVTITGSNLGTQKGTLTANGTAMETASWDDKTIVGLLTTAATQTGQKYSVIVKRPDSLQSTAQSCQVNTSSISLGARIFCRAAGQFDVTNVKVTIAPIETPDKTVEETVTIDKDGIIQGIKTKLQTGQQYIISVKAPNSLRRNTTITAQEGTAVANTADGKPFILPVGDIAPAIPDGQINGLDRSELVKQWRILNSSANSTLTGDFNRDKKVNSIDWACMRYDFNTRDDAPGQTGSTYTNGLNFNTGQGSVIFTTP